MDLTNPRFVFKGTAYGSTTSWPVEVRFTYIYEPGVDVSGRTPRSVQSHRWEVELKANSEYLLPGWHYMGRLKWSEPDPYYPRGMRELQEGEKVWLHSAQLRLQLDEESRQLLPVWLDAQLEGGHIRSDALSGFTQMSQEKWQSMGRAGQAPLIRTDGWYYAGETGPFTISQLDVYRAGSSLYVVVYGYWNPRPIDLGWLLLLARTKRAPIGKQSYFEVSDEDAATLAVWLDGMLEAGTFP